MFRAVVFIGLAVLLVAGATAWTNESTADSTRAPAGDSATAGSTSWLLGTTEQRFETIAEQFRGFGVTMMEVDRRYQELYFAGGDANWDYAAYQIEEMEEAIEYGLQRRPKRAASAAMLAPALDAVKAAVSVHDADAFQQAFQNLTATCNACHLAEDVPFIKVATPTRRVSSIRLDPGSATPKQ